MTREWIRVALGMFAVAFGANLFAPLLPVYRHTEGLTQSHVTFLFAVYVLGLIPALMVGGPLSDRIGRRAVIRPALLTSAFGSIILIFGVWFTFPALLLGRLVIGVSMGLVMAAGATWIREISPASTQVSARRATIALTSGFALGPLASGMIAQFASHPNLTPYVTHLAILALITPLTWRASGGTAPTETPVQPHTVAVPNDSPTRGASSSVGHRYFSPALRSPRFLWAVAAWAPWVFGAACTSFVVLPTIAHSRFPIAFVGVVAFLTLGTGVIVQPLATRISRNSFIPPAIIGLCLATLGMLAAIIVSITQSVWSVLPTAIILGASYGVMMVSGLREVQIIAPAEELGAATAVYYSLTYVGFVAPFIFSFLAPAVGFIPLFVVGAAIALLSAWPVAKVAQSTSH